MTMKIHLVTALLVLATPVAYAQDADINPPPEKCRAAPDGEGATTPADPTKPSASPDSLTDTLADCNGVLAPPPTGDQGIAEPAPNTGETPVIKPDELPQQPPQ